MHHGHRFGVLLLQVCRLFQGNPWEVWLHRLSGYAVSQQRNPCFSVPNTPPRPSLECWEEAYMAYGLFGAVHTAPDPHQAQEEQILAHLLDDHVIRHVSNIKSEELGVRQYR